ncbi:glycoside hydrolase family protein [Gaoshiqia sediminis]|uniref:Glycoside hydrolase family protein n=1 Tax=Gaoshiqia sediminis TaxID=2986998 RepID=A0AA42C710_9BACT|nr:glycoside hydrolase family protein [Gaoshiqia sediminis]MCW0483109.1 glycoside hydrolase family protein [Gaoshiqia sediminis]
MKRKILQKIYLFVVLVGVSWQSNAQFKQTERPAEWSNLVFGGRFMDRFLPIPVVGELTDDRWGGKNVVPRYIDNGIEDSEWSYWGGNVLKGKDGNYHLFVCRWREDSPKGHGEWPNSIVVKASSDHPIGPYRVEAIIGKGHNPEAFRLEDGRIVIYVIDGYYIAESMESPWSYHKFEFDNRDRPIIEGLSNLSFAKREDGSFIMVCRGGGIWFSKDGISPYHQVTDQRVYPDVDGRFEDPVIWKTNIQYHMIVNDWYGRIAYYLRSKDGIHWKIDPGEAYIPGITNYEDGTTEDWFKYERIKILQDEYGRAIQANFAVIDTLKFEDKPNDRHSSKNISIPLTAGKLITILNKEKIGPDTPEIRLQVQAEEGFDPHSDIDLSSLHFGASEEVNFGRGSKLVRTEKAGVNLILVFEGAGNGLSEDNFVAKLLGKTSQGQLLFAYARLPWLNYNEPALSARLPVADKLEAGCKLQVEIQNFGQVRSKVSSVKIEQLLDGQSNMVASGEIPELEPFGKIMVQLVNNKNFVPDTESQVKVTIETEGQNTETLTGKLKTHEISNK